MDGIIRSTSLPGKLSLKELDFMTEGKGINIGGEGTPKTYFGAAASLGIYGVLILAIVYYVIEFLDETNPNVQFSRALEAQASEYRARDMGTFIYLLVGNPNAKIQDQSHLFDPTKDKSNIEISNISPGVQTTTTTPTENSHASESDNAGAGSDSKKRVLQTTTNTYLTRDQLDLYFYARLRHEVLEFGFEGTDDFRVVSSRVIPIKACSQVAWFTDEQFQESLKENIFLYNLVAKYGICFDFDEHVQIYGDPLSKKSSRVRFTLDYCDSKTASHKCRDDSLTSLRDSYGVDMVLGTFEPNIDLTNRDNPWVYDLTSDHRLTLDVLATATVTLSMKNLSIATDTGLIVESVTEDFKAAPLRFLNEHAPSFKFGKAISTVVSGSTETDMYTVTYGGHELTYLDFRIISSRASESFQRSYVSLLDLFGNIGGSVEFVIVCFLILFHWFENTNTEKVIQDHLRKAFGLPEKKFSSPSPFACCRKRKAGAEQQDQSGELKFADESLSELGESAISIERLAVNDATTTLLLKSLVPAAILKLSPVITLMEKMLEAKAEEENSDPKRPHNEVDNHTGGQEMTNLKTGKPSPQQEELNLQEAYDWLHREKNHSGLFKDLIENMHNTLEKFSNEYKINDMKAYLATSDAEKKDQTIPSAWREEGPSPMVTLHAPPIPSEQPGFNYEGQTALSAFDSSPIPKESGAHLDGESNLQK